MTTSSRARAFTLIELLMVIAIIGLLATITTAVVASARAKSRDAKRASDLQQVRKALEIAYGFGESYPVAAAPIALGTASAKVLCASGTALGFKPDQTPVNCDPDAIYMGLVPENPAPGGGAYTYRSTDSTGNACAAGPCEGYCIQADFEHGIAASGLASGAVRADQSSIRNGTCP